MKRILLLLTIVSMMAGLNACKKDDPTPEPIESAVTEWVNEIKAPNAMVQSSDPYAQQAYGYIVQAQSIAAWSASLQPPANAEIVGKTFATSTIYQWTDAASGWVIQMNAFATSTHNKWEFSISTDQGATFLRYFNAEEKLSGDEGSIVVYDDWFSGTTGILYQYDWTYINNVLTLTLDYPFSDFEMILVVNADGSGEVTYIYDGSIQYEMNWDAIGNGTWVYYDISDGSIIDSGSWTV